MKIDFDGTVHEFPDDFTDEDVKRALASMAPPAAPMQGVQAGASTASAAPPPSMLQQGVQALPAIGGALGGFVPGPLGIPAAGAGQAIGELGRQAFSGPPGIENPAGIGQEAIKGAAFGAMGGLAGKAVGKVAQGAFAVGGKVAPKIAKTLMKHGVNVGEGNLIDIPGAKFGAEKLASVRKVFNSKTRALYAEADTQVGKTLPVRELTDAIRDQAAKLPNKMERRAFERMAQKFDKSHSAYVTPSELRIMKQRAQNLVNYKGDKIGPRTQEFNRTIAGVARGKLTSLGQIGKKIEAADGEIGRLKDASRALRTASNRVPGAGAGVFQPIAGMVDHPQLYSTLALMLNSTKGAANQGTRALGNLVLPPEQQP